MAWGSRVELEENAIIIGFKHPINYSNTILTMLFNFGQCIVFVPLNKTRSIKGKDVTCMNVWTDVKKFLGYAGREVVSLDKFSDKYRYVVE